MARKRSSAGTTVALLVTGGVVLAHMHPAAAAPAPGHHGFTVSATESVSANVRLGRSMAASRYGWTGVQWGCLYTLWQGESGWSQYADTRRSGLDPANAAVFAYGIPQARPDTKMPLSARAADQGGQSSPVAQIRWGLTYIKGRYGDPCAALAFKRANGNQGY